MTQPTAFFNVAPILSRLSNGQLILTPNQRLASRIMTAYALTSEQRGAKVVATPAVYSMQHWLDRCWQRLLINGYPAALAAKPLTMDQEQAIWEQLISNSDYGSALLRPAATAQRAISAYRSLVEWQLDIQQSAVREQFLSDEDATEFLNWAEQFQQRCRQQCWLPQVQVAKVILAAFSDGMLQAEGDILGIGFEDMPPLHQQLVEQAGTFAHYHNDAGAGEVSVVSCDSAQQELTVAAVWSKQVLKHDPQATVAVVVPELSQQRQTVQRIFLEVFEPAFNQPLNQQGAISERQNLPFNLSAGYPLAEAPVIVSALNALSLILPTLELSTLTAICQSPFYCLDNADVGRLDKLIYRLHDQRSVTLSTARFRQLAAVVAGGDDADLPPWPFARALQNIAALATPSVVSQSRPAGEWLSVFNQILQAIGWPGKRSLDSVEYQQATQWQQALQTLSVQQLVLEPLSGQAALSQLRGILSRTVFQPQTADSSLQILGTLEAAGLQFSHIWLMSMSEQQWPAAPSPNPLLPFALQRQQQMPHATAERELNYAKNISLRFIHSAAQVVVSTPTVIDDNPARVSRLFERYPEKTLQALLGRPLSTLVPAAEIRRRYSESQQLEVYDAANAPVLQDNEAVTGGSGLFASQSACPFRAFAGHRLGLKPLAQANIGLNAADRGSLLHRALELAWQKLKNQPALLAMDTPQLQQLSESVSRYTLDEFSQGKGSRIGYRFKQLEIDRLQKLIVAWLKVESSRAEFSVVALEDSKQFQFGPLKLQARIDRIDQFADGSLLIIDYKTGNAQPARWWGERPEEPQLPLYSMLTETDSQTVAGIAFAQVRAEGCELKGVGDENIAESGLQWQTKTKTDSGQIDWPHLKQYWAGVLSALANDFIQGKSMVDPKQPMQTCQYCSFASLCRINHQSVAGL